MMNIRMEYIFFLGRTPDLCRAELEAVLKKENINYQLLFTSEEIFHLKTLAELNVQSLINLLGGTVKISKVFDSVIKPFKLNEFINKVIPFLKIKKRDFGLSFYGPNFCIDDSIHRHKEIKRILKEDGFRVNYVLPRDGLILSSVVVAKKKLTEINIIEENKNNVLAETLMVQDFENWSKRDYGRPNVLPKKGMLPPKVARMMVNLGTQDLGPRTKVIKLLDPFCGMGTILAEAMMVGYNVIGSDIDKESVEKTKKNLEWTTKQFSVLSPKFSVLISDATHVSEKLEKESVDAIVTEPYLGPLVETRGLEPRTKNKRKLTREYLTNIITGLEKLYLGCLKDWWKVLKSDGRIVIAIPSFNIRQDQRNISVDISENPRLFVKKTIDICEKLGYNLLCGPYKYSRPQAVVERNIYVLKKLKAKS